MLVITKVEIRQPDHGRLAYRCDGCLKGGGYMLIMLLKFKLLNI